MSAASSCVSQVETLVLFIAERPSTRGQYATLGGVEIHNIPMELQKLPQWVLWRGADKVNEQTEEAKLNKIPIDLQTLHNANTTEPTTWGTFEHCCRALQGALAGWENESPDTSRGG